MVWGNKFRDMYKLEFFWKGQQIWHTYVGNTGGGTILFRIKYKIVLNIFSFWCNRGWDQEVFFEKLIWAFLNWCRIEDICISQRITINYPCHKEFIYLSDSGLLGWGFDHLTRLGGDGVLGPLHHLLAW